MRVQQSFSKKQWLNLNKMSHFISVDVNSFYLDRCHSFDPSRIRMNTCVQGFTLETDIYKSIKVRFFFFSCVQWVTVETDI